MKWGCCTRTTGVFPFCLAQQAIFFPRFLREFVAEFDGHIPRYLFYRTFFAFEIGYVVSHHCLPLCLGDGVFAYMKSWYCDSMLRTFVLVSSSFAFAGTHHKCAAWN